MTKEKANRNEVVGMFLTYCRKTLADALEKLCPEEQAIILLSYFAGWSDRRIGEDMGFPRSTVQNRRARALARLADILTEGGDPHGKDKD